MRVTNKIMTTTMQSNINRNKENMLKIGNQYSTGKKIQSPSEDPAVAVRTLKFRSQLSELEQYYEKNIPDAKSWMEVTESALDSVNDILTKMNTYCNQGANDTLTQADRNSILETLQKYSDQVYQDANTDYAGRFVFTGYRTDTPLLFTQDTNTTLYSITENLTGKDMDQVSYVMNENSYDAAKTETDYNNMLPSSQTVNRLRLAYSNLNSDATACSKVEFTEPDTATTVKVTTMTPTGSTVEIKNIATGAVMSSSTNGNKINVVSVSSTTPNPYQPAAGEINFVPETGELIIGDTLAATMKNATAVNVTYDKTNFNKGDIRPEQYFQCTAKDTTIPSSTPISYNKPSTQNIEYDINFSQKLTVNTMACNSISTDIGRQIDDIVNSINKVNAVEQKITDVDKQISTTTNTAQLAALNKLKENLTAESALKNKEMQQAFNAGIAMTKEQQSKVNVALADHGSRYVRLELVESRLSDQKIDFQDMLDKNDNVELDDVIIDYNAAQVSYNASLSAAAKVVKNSLLDFL